MDSCEVIHIYKLWLDTPLKLVIHVYITGIPLVYELDAEMKRVKDYYLADEAAVKAAMDKVANQGKAK